MRFNKAMSLDEIKKEYATGNFDKTKICSLWNGKQSGGNNYEKINYTAEHNKRGI